MRVIIVGYVNVIKIIIVIMEVRILKDRVLKQLISNMKEDFGIEPCIPITQYSEFERYIRFLLHKKLDNNQLGEEKLKTEAILTDKKNRNFWEEMSHAFSFVSIVITIILALGDISDRSIFSMIALMLGVVIFPFAMLTIPCSKYIAGQIQYYEYKLRLINELLEENNESNSRRRRRNGRFRSRHNH